MGFLRPYMYQRIRCSLLCQIISKKLMFNFQTKMNLHKRTHTDATPHPPFRVHFQRTHNKWLASFINTPAPKISPILNSAWIWNFSLLHAWYNWYELIARTWANRNNLTRALNVSWQAISVTSAKQNTSIYVYICKLQTF